MDTPNPPSGTERKGPSPSAEVETPAAADSTPKPPEVSSESASNLLPPLPPPARSTAGLSGVRTPVMTLDSSAIAVSTAQPTLFDKPSVRSEHKSGQPGSNTDKVPVEQLRPLFPFASALKQREIGKFRLLELIGEGGMGLVYRAEDKYLKRTVALKVMKPKIAKNERAWRAFLDEARATAQLNDDRIATIYGAEEIDGKFCLAMELLRGEPLEARLRRGPVPWSLALWVVREAALGLTVAHEAGFVHRDIKPANLWLEVAAANRPSSDPLLKFRDTTGQPAEESQYLRVKILDFGLVRLEEDDSSGSKRNSIVGTPLYMAPEQAAGKPADARSDLFSLGVVLFRMLTGRAPFEGISPTEILKLLATETIPPVSQFNPNVPAPLVALVQSLLRRNPKERPQTAAGLAESIQKIEQQLFAPPVVRAAAPVRRGRGIIVGVALALAIGSFIFCWQLFADRRQEEIAPIQNPNPGSGVLAPSQVMDAIGDRVTVEFVVGSVWRSGDEIMLYEQAPKPNEVTFRVALAKQIITTMNRRGIPWPEALPGAKVRFQGTVFRQGDFVEIAVVDVNQIGRVVYDAGGKSKKNDNTSKDEQ